MLKQTSSVGHPLVADTAGDGYGSGQWCWLGIHGVLNALAMDG